MPAGAQAPWPTSSPGSRACWPGCRWRWPCWTRPAGPAARRSAARDGARGRPRRARCSRIAGAAARAADRRADAAQLPDATCPGSPPRPGPGSTPSPAPARVIRDTRKTTPGLRQLEKYAVRCGGGRQPPDGPGRRGADQGQPRGRGRRHHGAAIRAVRRGRAAACRSRSSATRWTRSARRWPPGRELILLDNMSLADLRAAVAWPARYPADRARGQRRPALAAARAVAHTGVDYLSVGALTHSSPALDLGLDPVSAGSRRARLACCDHQDHSDQSITGPSAVFAETESSMPAHEAGRAAQPRLRGVQPRCRPGCARPPTSTSCSPQLWAAVRDAVRRRARGRRPGRPRPRRAVRHPRVRARRGRLPRPGDRLPRRLRGTPSPTSAGGADVYYAGKAFLCTEVARWIAADGLSLDVCSGGELAVALRAGMPPERIALHGNNKSDAELDRALAAGIGPDHHRLARRDRPARRRSPARPASAPRS